MLAHTLLVNSNGGGFSKNNKNIWVVYLDPQTLNMGCCLRVTGFADSGFLRGFVLVYLQVVQHPNLPIQIVLFGRLARKMDGDSWFTWWFFLIYQGYPSISPRRTPTTWPDSKGVGGSNLGSLGSRILRLSAETPNRPKEPPRQIQKNAPTRFFGAVI